MIQNPTLDCQDCGAVVKKLTDAEAQKVADNPYNYVVYCVSCRSYRGRNL
jgi:hypothetical protein